jgi:hypothetical protein
LYFWARFGGAGKLPLVWIDCAGAITCATAISASARRVGLARFVGGDHDRHGAHFVALLLQDAGGTDAAPQALMRARPAVVRREAR